MQRVIARARATKDRPAVTATRTAAAANKNGVREIVVPASIANLGPGFDTLGLAVALYLRVRVTRTIDDGLGRLQCRFTDGPLCGPNGIQRAFAASAAKRRKPPSLAVDVQS